MKKAINILIISLGAGALTACTNDGNDLPDVSFNIEFNETAAVIDGSVYVVQGQPLNIESLTVTNKEAGKRAAIAGAVYYFDSQRLGGTSVPPFAFEIPGSVTAAMPAPGNHALEIECSVVAEDKAPAVAVLTINVKIVETAADIPSEGAGVDSGGDTTPSIEITGRMTTD